MNRYASAHAPNPELNFLQYRQQSARCQAVPQEFVARLASGMNKYSE
jgi:hypothetical protein